VPKDKSSLSRLLRPRTSDAIPLPPHANVPTHIIDVVIGQSVTAGTGWERVRKLRDQIAQATREAADYRRKAKEADLRRKKAEAEYAGFFRPLPTGQTPPAIGADTPNAQASPRDDPHGAQLTLALDLLGVWYPDGVVPPEKSNRWLHDRAVTWGRKQPVGEDGKAIEAPSAKTFGRARKLFPRNTQI
jgi:hypothetical protein